MKKIGFTCGFTGGHTYPAIAVAQALKGAEAVFIGSENREDTRIIQTYGFAMESISASSRNPALMVKGFFQARKLIKKHRLAAILSTGGYLTLPVALAAFSLGVPVFLHEQNVRPGRANRMAAFLAAKVFVSFEESVRGFGSARTLVTGNPIRKTFPGNVDWQGFEKGHTKTILVFGGSQGARAINRFFEANHYRLLSEGYSIIHLTGEKDAPKKPISKKILVLPYCEAMDKLYAVADLVVCRAGATSIAELMHYGIPAILIPYPHAKDNHQRLNADAFERMGFGHTLLEADLRLETLLPLIKKTEPLHLPKSPPYESAEIKILDVILSVI